MSGAPATAAAAAAASAGDGLYTDAGFPQLTRAHGEGVEWVRVRDILLRQGAAPGADLAAAVYTTTGGASQGIIRNCWLVSALVTLGVREPSLPKRIVEYNVATGRCEVRLYRAGGAATTVVIDDRLPHRNGEPVFAKAHGGDSFWIPLVEKACAKLHGGYERLEGGLEVDAFHDVVGWAGDLCRMADYAADFKSFHALFERGALGVSSFAADAGGGAPAGGNDPNQIHATVSLGDSGEPLALHFAVDDDPEKIAAGFADAHGLGPCKIGAIAAFVKGHQDEARKALAAQPSPHTARPDTTETILESHSYTVVAVDAAAEVVQLVNPWGGGVPGCAVPAPAGAAPSTLAGAFWLPFSVLAERFDALHVALPGGTHHTATIVKSTTTAELFEVPAGADGNYLLVVYAPDRRSTSDPTAPYAPLGFHTFPHGPGGAGAKAARCSPIIPARQVALRCELAAGDHIVQVTHGAVDTEYTLVVYQV